MTGGLRYEDVYPDGNDGTSAAAGNVVSFPVEVPQVARLGAEPAAPPRARETKTVDAAADLVSPPGEPLPNARLFVTARYGHDEHERLVHQGGAFNRWDGTCWPEREDAALRSELYRFFEHKEYATDKGTKPFSPTMRKIADLLDALRAVVHVPITVTSPTWLPGSAPVVPAAEVIACANGLLHVPTRTLHTHTPWFFVHHSVPFAFDDTAPEPDRWQSFLRELWPDDDESIATLQEMFGYLVAGDTSQQKMFLIVGPKRGGKGTIGRVLTGLLGAHNVAGPTLAGLATNFGLQPLIGKPVALVSDARIRSGQEVLTERLLSISGEDTLTIDRKYREPWTGRLPARFVILTNELPRLNDSSGALASRFVLLQLVNSFYGHENPKLTDELLAELPGILNWSLDGLERLRERGRFVQPSRATQALRELEDLGSPVGAFLRDRCQVGPEHEVLVEVLFAAWKQWCSDNGRDRPGTKQTFGKDLRAAVPGLRVSQPKEGDGKQHRTYAGLGLA